MTEIRVNCNRKLVLIATQAFANSWQTQNHVSFQQSLALLDCDTSLELLLALICVDETEKFFRAVDACTSTDNFTTQFSQ